MADERTARDELSGRIPKPTSFGGPWPDLAKRIYKQVESGSIDTRAIPYPNPMESGAFYIPPDLVDGAETGAILRIDRRGRAQVTKYNGVEQLNSAWDTVREQRELLKKHREEEFPGIIREAQHLDEDGMITERDIETFPFPPTQYESEDEWAQDVARWLKGESLRGNVVDSAVSYEQDARTGGIVKYEYTYQGISDQQQGKVREAIVQMETEEPAMDMEDRSRILVPSKQAPEPESLDEIVTPQQPETVHSRGALREDPDRPKIPTI